jgi:pilus assembly protein CpaF
LPGYPQGFFRLPELEATQRDLLLKLQNDLYKHPLKSPDHRDAILKHLQETYTKTYPDLEPGLLGKLFSDVTDDYLLLQSLLELQSDPAVNSVTVNSYDRVTLVRNGKVEGARFHFEGKNQVLRLIELLFAQGSHSLDYSEPVQEMRLQDGSRLTVLLPPVAVDGPSLVLKKPPAHTFSAGYLVKNNTLSSEVLQFLQACVAARMNIIISGLKASGKTTLLNALAAFIPQQERVITIEDPVELSFTHPHNLRLETKPGSTYGTGAVQQANLLGKAIRLSPDRLVVGEIKGDEVCQIIKALCSGQEGFLSTINAHHPYDTLNRLESLCLVAEPSSPVQSIREQLAAAIDLVVHVACLKNDVFRVTSVAEVSGIAGGNIVLSEIFKFTQTGTTAQGAPAGTLVPTGTRPLFNSRLETAGFLFGPEIYGSSLGDVLPRKH